MNNNKIKTRFTYTFHKSRKFGQLVFYFSFRSYGPTLLGSYIPSNRMKYKIGRHIEHPMQDNKQPQTLK